MKSRDAERQPASVPPLFDPDPKRNLTAWVQKSFPNTPTIAPEEAIRLWLGKDSTNRPRAVETPAHHIQHFRGVGGIDTGSDSHRSDDRLVTTLQHIAEMVTAALRNEQRNEQQEPRVEDVHVRHPIYWGDSDQPQLKAEPDAIERTTVSANSRDLRVHEIAYATGNNNETELSDSPHVASPASSGSESGRCPSPSGAKSNGAGHHRLDLGESEEIAHLPGNNGKNELTGFPHITPPGSWGSASSPEPSAPGGESNGQSRHETDLEHTESVLPPHLRSSDHRTEAEATGRKRSISIAAVAAIVCPALLFVSIAVGGKLYRSNRIGPQNLTQPVLSVPAVKQSQPEPARMPVPTPTSNLVTEGIDTAHTASVQNVKVVRDQDRVAVEVRTKGRVVPRVTKLTRPDRLILDLADTTIPPSPRRIDVNIAGVKRIRMGANGLNPPAARVVVDLSEPCEYTLVSSSDKLTLQLCSVAQ